ncbi:MAG TPA: hypothetical protein VHE35_25880, partial [Kofleriaceae bacterium]|nr:hypothetical protein [Kofleriaceae bacterium]
MDLELTRLTEAALVALNHRVVERMEGAPAAPAPRVHDLARPRRPCFVPTRPRAPCSTHEAECALTHVPDRGPGSAGPRREGRERALAGRRAASRARRVAADRGARHPRRGEASDRGSRAVSSRDVAARRRHRATRDREWIGGIVSLPAFVTGEGRPYQPQTIAWLEVDGPVRAALAVRPGEALDRAAESLQGAIEQPMAGIPRAPARIRVASPDLAEVVRRSHPAIDVVCAPTPELDDFVAEIRARAAAEDRGTPSYLAGGVPPAQLASFFAAAAAMFRARPWAAMSDAEGVLLVSVPARGIEGQVLSVFGLAGESPGLALFRDFRDYALFVDAAEAAADGEELDGPPHLRLDFEPEATIDPALRGEVASQRWELAGREAYPWPVYAEADGRIRPPTPHEVAVLEAIARALTIVLEDAPAIVAAAHGGEPWARTVTVSTHAGELEVIVRALPADDDEPADVAADDDKAHVDSDERGEGAAAGAGDDDVLAALARMVDEAEGGPLDAEQRAALEDRLVDEFLETPEGAATSDAQGHRLFMDELGESCGVTIATATPTDLHEVLFDAIPRRVMLEASAAAAIVADLRAFYRFLDAAHALPQAATCLRVLDDSAVRRLAANLGDRRRFGPAKALVLAGRDAGYAVDTREGL